ncbi:DUF2604 domain-containing protein [Granulicella paludicola]|uniref:DUF2604 domain-containing protein n=1 Tax=Granulicella paludicola TaxID=474951 RepID=UPI0021DFDF29|nr:DUF2604 domain-containing protein [Granulicella paludicola]
MSESLRRDDEHEETENERYLKEELNEEHREEERLEEALEELHKREERTEKELEREREHHRKHEFFLVFIINGEDFRVACSPKELLRVAVEKALHESGNTGRRDVAEWEVRNEDGVLLEMGREIEKLELQDNARLFLSLKVGAGGTHAR